MTGEAALLELDVQLEFNDYLRFQYYEALRTQWGLIPLFLLGSAVSAVVFVISAVNQDSYLLRDIVPFASMVMLGGVFIVAGPYLTAKRNFWAKAALRQVIRYRIFEEHLAVIQMKFQGKVAWNKIRQVHETGSAFFVYVEGSGAFILPKHEFPSEGEISACRELLTVILGARKCRFRPGPIASHF
jgi:hypothetical protein